MKTQQLLSTTLAGFALAGALAGASVPAKADAGSTAAIAAAAGLIVGGLLVDSHSHRHYYVRNNRRVYVTEQTANYYQSHRGHAGYRGGGHQMNRGGHGGGDHHDHR